MHRLLAPHTRSSDESRNARLTLLHRLVGLSLEASDLRISRRSRL